MITIHVARVLMACIICVSTNMYAMRREETKTPAHSSRVTWEKINTTDKERLHNLLLENTHTIFNSTSAKKTHAYESFCYQARGEVLAQELDSDIKKFSMPVIRDQHGTVIAYGWSKPVGRELVIKAILIDKSHQGRGIARLLLQAMVDKTETVANQVTIFLPSQYNITFLDVSKFKQLEAPKHDQRSLVATGVVLLAIAGIKVYKLVREIKKETKDDRSCRSCWASCSTSDEEEKKEAGEE